MWWCKSGINHMISFHVKWWDWAMTGKMQTATTIDCIAVVDFGKCLISSSEILCFQFFIMDLFHSFLSLFDCSDYEYFCPKNVGSDSLKKIKTKSLKRPFYFGVSNNLHYSTPSDYALTCDTYGPFKLQHLVPPNIHNATIMHDGYLITTHP